jgi:glycosyltransferase involved in cell wall biosynthesis
MILTVICDVLGKENNGTTIAAMNLIRSMREKGHTVRVVCSDQDRRGQKDFYVVPTQNLGFLNKHLEKNGVNLSKPDKRIMTEAITGADAVHLLFPFPLAWMGAKTAHSMGVPITAGFHCQAENFTSHIFAMNSHMVNKLVYKVFDRKVYRYVGCIHYPTEFIKNLYESEVGHKTPHRVISNGVNSIFKPMPAEKPPEFADRFVILFTGRYSKEKSHRVLIEAANLSRYREKLQLIFAGCGPEEKRIRRLSQKLPHEPLFKFFTRSELVNIINYADLYVHPAEVEIEAIACLEAISCGLVPVISDSPRSATRYFAQSDRNLFKCNDARDLASKIDWWIEHPAERESCSRSYTGYSRQFEFSHCMDEMERMIIENARASGKAVC